MGRVIKWVEELRVAIVKRIATYASEDFEQYNGRNSEKLANKLHDLTELATRADSTILMPMDGYEGFSRLLGVSEGQSPGLEKEEEIGWIKDMAALRWIEMEVKTP